MVGSRDDHAQLTQFGLPCSRYPLPIPLSDKAYTRCPLPESRSVVIKERYWWPTLSAQVSCWCFTHSFTVISSNVFRLWTRQNKGEYRRTVFQYSRVDKLTDRKGLYRSPSCARHVFVSGNGCRHVTRSRTTVLAQNLSIRQHLGVQCNQDSRTGKKSQLNQLQLFKADGNTVMSPEKPLSHNEIPRLGGRQT